MIRVVQAGDVSQVRNVVLIYHADPQAIGSLVAKACPGAVVATQVFEPFKLKYTPQNLPALAAELAEIQNQIGGAWQIGSLILCGFSEGCQGVRTQVSRGNVPSAIVCADGLHAAIPLSEAQIAPLKAYCALARARERVAYLSHTQIDTTGYLPTKTVTPAVAAFTPAAQTFSDGDATITREGDLWMFAYPGKDAPAHVRQAKEVLPVMASGALLQAVAQGTSPVILPGGGTPPATPPAGPPGAPPGRPPPLAGPPPASSSGDGPVAAAVAFFSVLLLGLAFKK